MIFRVSILKSGVGFGHFLRALTYSADHALWMALFLIGCAACSLIQGLLTWPQSRFNGPAEQFWWYRRAASMVHWLFVAQMCVFFIRVGIARAKYLRVRQATAMLVLSQIILILALAVIIFNTGRLDQWWRLVGFEW